MIVGALAITTLQSIDQVFRIENYLNAFIVTIPAIFILVPLPIWSIHRRIKREKTKLIAEINREIKQAPRDLVGAELQRLNLLLQRREQIQKMRNWPMDLRIAYRFVLYVFIVPLAWTGAALMEVILDQYIVG